jgi:hypothetical protein
MDNQPPLVAEIEELIRRYLRAHPLATDTERGICEWWLHEGRESYSLAAVRTAIQRLVAAGELVRTVLPDGQSTYAGYGRRAPLTDVP